MKTQNVQFHIIIDDNMKGLHVISSFVHLGKSILFMSVFYATFHFKYRFVLY